MRLGGFLLFALQSGLKFLSVHPHAGLPFKLHIGGGEVMIGCLVDVCSNSNFMSPRGLSDRHFMVTFISSPWLDSDSPEFRADQCMNIKVLILIQY